MQTHTHTLSLSLSLTHTHTHTIYLQKSYRNSSGEQRPSKANKMWQVINLPLHYWYKSTSTDAKGAARLSEMHYIAASSIVNYAMIPQSLLLKGLPSSLK